jgi:serine/threonine-protein kinase
MPSETAELPIEGRYSLTDRVATYDLGPVELHSALDRQLERQVALQLMPPAAPPDDRARFLESQRIAAGIHHCGVVQVYDVGEWHGAAFSVVEKDAAAPGGPTPSPDAASALKTARLAAEALQCVRDAGLETWAFTPAALRTGADGAPRLALLEGLDHDARYRSAMSARREDDGRALGTLLGMLVAGLPLGAIPGGVHDLVERAGTRAAIAPVSAADFASEVAHLEQVAEQLTVQHAETPASAAVPYLAGGALDPHNAPTLAAPVVPAEPVVDAPPDRPYTGPRPGQGRQTEREVGPARHVPLVPLVGAGLLLLALLVFFAWPRALSSRGSGIAASAADITPTAASGAASAEPTAASTAVMVSAPEFLGKTLEEAKAMASAAGLGLLVASAAHDATYPADTIARQDPAPGAPVAPGSEVSLVVSLGPEQPPQQVEPPPPDNNQDGNNGNKNGKDNGKKKKP